MAPSDGETIQGGTLFKGGHYRLEKGFDWGHYLWNASVAISQTWNLMISWSDNYLIDFQCLGQKVRVEIRH